MKPSALLLIVLGLLLGPAYLAYCEYLSGEISETHTLTERANRWELPDGAILRLRSGMGYKPLPIELDPELNRYRFRLTFSAGGSDSALADATNNYQLSVLQGDVNVFERTFQVKGGNAVRVALDPLEIFYPGSYVLLLEETAAPKIAVSSVKLEIRSKVETPRNWLVWSGLVLLAFGVGVAIRDLVSARSRR